MNVVGEGSQLTYENFIYIAITETFGGCGTSTNDLEITGGAGPGMVQGVHALNLVFDVEGTRVFLAPKEAGKRSQLWRMTSAGLLVHEGSSPPQMPRGRGDAHQDLMANNLVLDIAGPTVQPNTYVPLMLRKPDERRLVLEFKATFSFSDWFGRYSNISTRSEPDCCYLNPSVVIGDR